MEWALIFLRYTGGVIKLHPHIEQLLRDNQVDDVEHFVNNLIFLYFNGGLFRPGEVAGRLKLDTVFRKQAAEVVGVYDEITHDFEGVEVVGATNAQSLFFPNQKLYELLMKHTEIIVLNSPRNQKGGIRKMDSDTHFYRDDDTLKN